MKAKYKHRIEDNKDSSPNSMVPILVSMFEPKSVVDIGCGIGNWLVEFQRQGIQDVFGIDGFQLDQSLFLLGQEKLVKTDLEKPLRLERKFDLAISLEVAGHLSEVAADNFVECLCLLSDNIIFSAAVPGQGGQNHINEQWPTYWKQKFEKNGFNFYDYLRPIIWNNNEIKYWYRQNTFIASRNKILVSENAPVLIDVIHPDMHTAKLKEFADDQYGVKVALHSLQSSIQKKLKIK